MMCLFICFIGFLAKIRILLIRGPHKVIPRVFEGFMGHSICHTEISKTQTGFVSEIPRFDAIGGPKVRDNFPNKSRCLCGRLCGPLIRKWLMSSIQSVITGSCVSLLLF